MSIALASVVASIPSPSQSVWHLGPFPLRAYALAIIIGIFVAVAITNRRWAERGGHPDEVFTIVYWAVPFGIVGGRLYHVVSSPDAYFGAGGDPVSALYIWQGGLGIWGAIALGAVGAWIGARRERVSFSAFADAVAPGLLVAQAIGRLGNWFNQELFGSPTTLPWGLEINPAVAARVGDFPVGTLFHPTFLYEFLWNLAAAALLVVVDRRRKLGHGRAFWGYVALYTLGRVWIESLRIDDAQLVLGLRLNVWTSILLLVVAVAAFILLGRARPGRPETVYLDPQDSRRNGAAGASAVDDGTDAPSGPAAPTDLTADLAVPGVEDADDDTDAARGVVPGEAEDVIPTSALTGRRDAAEAHDTSARRAQREDNAGADTGLP
ncbi:prolipoprotein diacylglyceryl transferase [Flavimobilis soli]|uniref:Phosphatidylglycerol--prolipoprotein diacylglyceryl transferase n=1 Tax=Flavimobilis soli TaxID=442709 RepID=A0A2A9EAZ3_9MICO|nr:prolipoprotein diacylglyceryl transferase [Flavimobilis soli]